MQEADLFFGTSGPKNADIFIVGEAWGFEEAAAKRPFVGASGKELDRMLSEGGVQRPLCFATNVIAARPPNNEMWRFFEPAKAATQPPLRGLHPDANIRASLTRLYEQLAVVHPKVVLAVGNYALWALTHCTGYSTTADSQGRRVPNGIDSWRGSQWFCDAAPPPLQDIRLVPILHPAGILRNWTTRACSVHDIRTRIPLALRNAWRPNPAPTILAPPTFTEATSRLKWWLHEAEGGTKRRLVCDVETVPSLGLLSCIGFADSKRFAMTLPLIVPKDGGKRFESYWTPEQEFELLALVRRVLMHPNILVEGQNFLYDTQWFYRDLGCIPNLDFDTMLAQHVMFPGMPKDLGYLSSLYCEHHWYWKDDGKEWDLREDPSLQWQYNAQDCWRQFEIGTIQRELLPKMQLDALWQERLDCNRLALNMMIDGMRIDKKRRARLALELAVAAGDLASWFERVIPQRFVAPEAKTPWYRSPQQQKVLFNELLGMALPTHRKTGRHTLGKEGLDYLKPRYPEFTRIFDALKDFRSLRVFRETFIEAPLDYDDHMRCMYNVAGPETFRFSSSENAFGRGTNLQNIPKGNEDQE